MSLKVQGDRWILQCNSCSVKMDLARDAVPRDHLRMPTGWLDLGDDHHACTHCSQAKLQQFRIRS
jgi:hypothetical protein